MALDAARAAEAGVEPDPVPAGLRFHDLRHPHASCLFAAGHSIKAVSRRLGHADITITLKVYAHRMPNGDVKLAEGANVLFGWDRLQLGYKPGLRADAGPEAKHRRCQHLRCLRRG